MIKKMSQKNDTDPELPAVPELTKDQLNRLVCADYLESLANMIRKGQVNGFDMGWDFTTEKPVGRVEIDSKVLIAPLEAKILQGVAKQYAEAAKKIPVVDATSHEKCTNPHCVACNNPNKA